MPGPTLQQRLDHLLQNLAEAEREYAAGVPYPDHTGLDFIFFPIHDAVSFCGPPVLSFALRKIIRRLN